MWSIKPLNFIIQFPDIKSFNYIPTLCVTLSTKIYTHTNKEKPYVKTCMVYIARISAVFICANTLKKQFLKCIINYKDNLYALKCMCVF